MRIPFLGWSLAAALEQSRFRPMVQEVERQLRARPDTTNNWGAPSPRQEVSRRLRPILADEFGWPNDHFLPDDPFGIVFWAHRDGLDDVLAIQQIEKLFAVSIPIAALEELSRHGTLGEFVDLLLTLRDCHAHKLSIRRQTCMKPRSKRIAIWFSIAVSSYFVLYFSSVRAVVAKSRGSVTPRPDYIQSNTEFVHALFAPAHFIDASVLRRGYWAPRPASSREQE